VAICQSEQIAAGALGRSVLRTGLRRGDVMFDNPRRQVVRKSRGAVVLRRLPTLPESSGWTKSWLLNQRELAAQP